MLKFVLCGCQNVLKLDEDVHHHFFHHDNCADL